MDSGDSWCAAPKAPEAVVAVHTSLLSSSSWSLTQNAVNSPPPAAMAYELLGMPGPVTRGCGLTACIDAVANVPDASETAAYRPYSPSTANDAITAARPESSIATSTSLAAVGVETSVGVCEPPNVPVTSP